MLGIIARLCLSGEQIDELLLTVYVEFAVDVAGVVLHGVVRDGKLFLDVLGVVAAGEQGEHLPLALSEGCLLGYLLATCTAFGRAFERRAHIATTSRTAAARANGAACPEGCAMFTARP